MQDDIPLIDDEEDVLEVEDELLEEKLEEKVKEVVEMRPTRGSVRGGGVISLPLTTTTTTTTGGPSAQTELSPDVFQIRAPIVSLESLILSPASTNLDMEPAMEVREGEDERAASLSSKQRELRQKIFSLNNKQLELEEIENCFELRAEEELELFSQYNCQTEAPCTSWDLISLD